MQQIATITSQGQITIPASMRRQMFLDKFNKAFIRTEDKKILIEPIIDLLSLGGTLANKAKKQRNINQIIDLEERTISKMIR